MVLDQILVCYDNALRDADIKILLSVSSGMYRDRPDSKEGRISLKWLQFGSCFMSQYEGMSESPVETLEKVVGLRLIWTGGITSL